MIHTAHTTARAVGAYVISRAGEIIYRYQECLNFASKSNNLTDRFLFFLHFDPVLLYFLSSFIYISHFMMYLCI